MYSFKRTLYANLKNIGISLSKRKLIVFESDDWGSNRINSLNDYNLLVKKGILTNNVSHYNKYDTIAGAKDLQALFEVLAEVKDKNGHHAVFTPFVNPCNPYFDKIKESDYRTYYCEKFTDTLNRTGKKKEVLNLWQYGIQNKIFLPAFHGREHLCVPIWMHYLQEKNEIVRKAFEHNFYAVPLNTIPLHISAFRSALFFSDVQQIPILKESLTEGINQMNEIFRVKPKIFCPPNGISHSIFDETCAKKGIKSVMTNRFRPEPDGKGGLKKKYYAYGSKNEWDQRYYYRNCVFEPTYSSNAVNLCLMQIGAAFRWKKPAIITTHRVNYIGSLVSENRDVGLKQLSALLKMIVIKWPDVEFISSDEFSDILHKNIMK